MQFKFTRILFTSILLVVASDAISTTQPPKPRNGNEINVLMSENSTNSRKYFNSEITLMIRVTFLKKSSVN